MAALGAYPVHRNTHLIPAMLVFLLSGLLTVLELRLFGQSWPLTWLPLAVVALWPRQVAMLPTALLFMLGGLWVDWTTLGAPGQWSLVFLIAYLLVSPGRSEGDRGLTVGMSRFAATLAIGLPVFILTGRLVYGIWPDWAALGRGVCVATVLVPLLILGRDALARRMSRDD
ncbi:hypothetical protein ACFFUB_12885 [Algimonas porphyrae]|uniref:Rod shape-determining protein MreD n=1 Tax=Algimonas porphyrae TaxID=1128113 RepID=A0ABQ5UVK5_9PROT|nr:hypothetical protein [Algimonas porphyrae]GLQ19309.1 hypothetical protein GCM10007854_02640 [Algimonas porphyrae]